MEICFIYLFLILPTLRFSIGTLSYLKERERYAVSDSSDEHFLFPFQPKVYHFNIFIKKERTY